jgi:hypothetical protein
MKPMRLASLGVLPVAVSLMLLAGCSVLGNGKQRDPVEGAAQVRTEL